jgi:penicillin-binding protein 1C
MSGRRATTTLAALAVLAVTAWLLRPVPPGDLAYGQTASLQVVDRRGELLREVLSTRQGRGRWVQLEHVSPYVIDAVLAAEDIRFYSHPGIDPIAVARAAWHNLRARRIVSGASTITQQTAQLLYGDGGLGRGWAAKLREAGLALRLEVWLSKDEILTHYLNRAPFGNQVFGIEAAAQFYYDKPAAHLSLAEAALLAGLPQAPSRNDPLRRFANAQRRQIRVLHQMREGSLVTASAYTAALRQPVAPGKPARTFASPHFVEHVLRRLAPRRVETGGKVKTTLDAGLQRSVSRLAKAHVAALEARGVTNASVVVMDVATGDVLSWVGSVDFFDVERHGQVDGVLARRQPGSALKPFTYGLALERGTTAATVLADLPTFVGIHGGDFVPTNYDGRFHGPVRVRTALACSYNVPAVRVLETMGADVLLHRLRLAGFASLSRDAAHYGLGLTLGNGEVTLLELTQGYAALARGGRFLAARTIDGDPSPSISAARATGPEVFAPAVAFLISDILDDDDARQPAFHRGGALELPFACAVKTGTSKDYRDAWCVGYTARVVVGVWMGDFAGASLQQVPGALGPGALFRDVMQIVHEEDPTPGFMPPPGVGRVMVCSLSGMASGVWCPQRMLEWFIDGMEPNTACDWHQAEGTVYPPQYAAWAEQVAPAARRQQEQAAVSTEPLADVAVVFPDEGDVFRMDPVLRPEFQTLRLRSTVPSASRLVTWLVNGQPVARTGPPFDARWSLQPGRHTVQAVADAGGRSKALHFTVLPGGESADAELW